jgi:two-component system, NarL family, nitrate/nitrite response regulator NarL
MSAYGATIMKVLLADDHDLVRDTLAAYLMREPGIEVVTAADFPSVGKRIKAEGQFDLVLLDYNMPGMNGLQGLAKALELTGGRPVAIISGSANRAVAEEALAAGAMGFLPKSMAARSLVHAIRFMAAGEKYAPIDFMSSKDDTENPLLAQLTKREVEVLKGLMKGQSNKEIARDVDLQEVTVKLHVKTLCRKINARNRTHAAMIAKEAGLN